MRNLKEIQVDKSQIIGFGSNSTFYKYQEDSVIKLYNKDVLFESIEHEKVVARETLILDLPTAISLFIVKCDNLYGVEYEYLDCNSFAQEIVSRPDKIHDYVVKFTKLAKQIHSTNHKVSNRPNVINSATDKYLNIIENAICLTAEEKEVLVNLIENIPQKLTLVHGDYHTKNIMVQGGDLLLIDVGNMSFGHAIYDLCKMQLMFCGLDYQGNQNVNEQLGIDSQTAKFVWDEFLVLYFDQKTQSQIELIKKQINIYSHFALLMQLIIGGKCQDSHFDAIKNYALTLANSQDCLIEW